MSYLLEFRDCFWEFLLCFAVCMRKQFEEVVLVYLPWGFNLHDIDEDVADDWARHIDGHALSHEQLKLVLIHDPCISDWFYILWMRYDYIWGRDRWDRVIIRWASLLELLPCRRKCWLQPVYSIWIGWGIVRPGRWMRKSWIWNLPPCHSATCSIPVMD